MGTVTRFKRYARATVVEGDAVYLTTERAGQTRLEGRMMERLAPLLEGKHSRADIVAALEGQYSAERLERALDRLLATGHVVDVDPDVDERAGGYWELAGLSGDQAVRAVASTTVRVDTVGQVRPEWFTEAAEALSLTVADTSDAALDVIVTDDYERPELGELNRRALETGRAWMVLKPVGAVTWLGPIIEPGQTACFECLRARLRNKQLLHSYFRQRGVLQDVLVNSLTELPGTVQLGSRMAALEVAKWAAGAPTKLRDQVLTLDTLSTELEQHPLTRRPQCPACGEPELQAARQREPVEVRPQPKTASTDGGHRALEPQHFVDTYQYLVSPVSGPVSNLTKTPLGVEGLHSYTAGQNFAVVMRSASDLRSGLRSASSGKGASDQQARASALGEAIERYSGVYHGDEARFSATLRELGDDAVEPNDLHLYSDQQFADRAEWNSRPSHFHWVADRLDPDARAEWSPVWSLTKQQHRYLPTSALYFSYGHPDRLPNVGANSNGCAAGSSLEDAILQGFFELVERDSVAMWWYHRLRFPNIDLDSFDDPYFASWQRRYRELNRQTWVLDITNDLGIPSVVAVSYRTDKPVQDILFALGSHFDMRVAIGRALSEMNQFLPAVIGVHADGTGRYGYDDPDQLSWWRTATLDTEPYLLPADGPARTAADYTTPKSDDLADDVRHAQHTVESRGMEMLVLDQTRVDIGLPVARVIVPGMRHFWPRYAPGRLFDVPVELGWLDQAPAESDLNPIAMFL